MGRVILLLLALLFIMSASAQRSTALTWRGELAEVPFEVTVVARGHTVLPKVHQTRPWWTWGNTESDAYLFSFGGDGGVDIVLDFWPVTGRPTIIQATMYHLSGDARHGITLTPEVLEGYRLPPGVDPALAVQPTRGGWFVSGKPNFNLETRRFVRYDDYLQEFHGRVSMSRPGEPAWALSQLMNDRNPHLGYPRFNATIRADPSVPYELADPLMPTWPYFSVTPSVFHWGPNRPIVYELSTGHLTQYWGGFHIAGSYQFNSLSLPPHTDFEAPFAFYRFDPDAGRYANLVMRSDVWPAVSPFGPAITGVPRTAVRMTWTARDPALWRYSLTVLGNHEMRERVNVGGLQVRAVSYDDFPTWVAEKPWKVVTFVESTLGQRGSEGIYDYTVEDNYPVSYWAEGLLEQEPGSFKAPLIAARTIGPGHLAVGLRGEYGAVYNRKPALYLSPIDNRVHLLHAEGGLWNLGGGAVLRYGNLDEDAHLDAWWRERVPVRSARARALGGTLDEALYKVDNLLLHYTKGTLTLQEGALPDSVGVPPLPTDREAWDAFLKGTTRVETGARDPFDLRSWLVAFPGETLELTGARVREVRASAEEFRFVLELSAEGTTRGTLLLSSLRNLTPGAYVIRYNRVTKRWSSEAATSPRLDVTLKASSLQTFKPATLALSIRNRGSTDLVAGAVLQLGDRVVKRWPELHLEGTSTFHETVAWVPQKPGREALVLKVGEKQIASRELEVNSAPRISGSNAFKLPIGKHVSGVVMLLAAAGIVGASALWTTWRST